MYSKYKSMKDARQMFDEIPDRIMNSWNLMINGYAPNDEGDDGLHLFEKMRDVGVQPNSQTFLYVLVACASANAVEKLLERLKVVPGDDFLSMEAHKNATLLFMHLAILCDIFKGARNEEKSNTILFGGAIY
ncbi:hypothetical protein IEQ34_003588 [Dendrobium chrysotoxum]|uniref:RNA polymerase Rpb1 domain-containing protein n=1 Tax=Dendrobium chrysotoxum TaxID=161865 RepID=A0AAV7H371_DENCH|nr:hypothetical protein IEQ34_003588 [Dendrobium chrysotoxum]